MTNPEFNYTTYIKSTPQKVWDAITNPEFTRQYWGGNHNNASGWKAGSKWQLVSLDSPNDVKAVGEVLESNPPQRLVVTWVNPSDSTDQSRATYEIEQIEDMVRLKVTHDQFKAGSDMASRVSQGWPRVLSSLKSFLETGKALNIWTMKCAAA